MTWTRAVVQRLAEKIKTGTKFFIDHGHGTNSHEDRDAVGEIVVSYTDTIEGRLSNIAIGHFPDEDKVKEMDVCSIEAEVYTDEQSIVGDIDEVTGVALGSSDTDNPAFPGALRLGAVQCFTNADDSGKEDNEEMGKEKIVFDDVRTAVREMNIFPSQLFDLDAVKKDRDFSTHFDNVSTLTAENERLKKELETSKSSNQEATKKAEVATANTRLDEKLKEGFTDLQKSFIKERFNPDTMESVSDESLDKFLETTKTDFATTAKLFNVVEDGKPPAKKPEGNGNSEDAAEDFDKALKEIGV